MIDSISSVTNVFTPVDEHSAKAISETAKLGQEAVKATVAGGSWVADILGDLPKNLVGLLGDHAEHIRRRRWHELCRETDRRLAEREIYERVDPTFNMLLPIMAAAVDEGREEMKELWQRLLTNACDPSRLNRVRNSFIEILKRMDPCDARVLEQFDLGPEMKPSVRDFIQKKIGTSLHEIAVSFENLKEFGLLNSTVSESWNPVLSSRGRLFLDAVAL